MIKVYSKTELVEETKNKILETLKSKCGQNDSNLKEVEFLQDKNIISGIKIDIDSEIIDLTLNNRLEKILNVLN